MKQNHSASPLLAFFPNKLARRASRCKISMLQAWHKVTHLTKNIVSMIWYFPDLARKLLPFFFSQLPDRYRYVLWNLIPIKYSSRLPGWLW